jgi:Rrf2 family protein
MKLSTQEEYGLRCVLQMARRGDDASVTLADLARLEGVSQPNVAKIMRILRRAGFVRSTRGQAGGYTLARPAAEIKVGDVLAAMGGRLYDASFCESHAGAKLSCTHTGDCSIRPVLMQVQIAIDQVLGKLTLGQLLCSEIEMRSRAGPKAIPLSVVEVRTS